MKGICGIYRTIALLSSRLDAHYGADNWRIVGRDLETLHAGEWQSYYRVAHYRSGLWQVYDPSKN